MKNKKWTEEELQVIKDNFGDYAWHEYCANPNKEIKKVAKQLGRTIKEVVAKINSL